MLTDPLNWGLRLHWPYLAIHVYKSQKGIILVAGVTNPNYGGETGLLGHKEVGSMPGMEIPWGILEYSLV